MKKLSNEKMVSLNPGADGFSVLACALTMVTMGMPFLLSYDLCYYADQFAIKWIKMSSSFDWNLFY